MNNEDLQATHDEIWREIFNMQKQVAQSANQCDTQCRSTDKSSEASCDANQHTKQTRNEVLKSADDLNGKKIDRTQ